MLVAAIVVGVALACSENASPPTPTEKPSQNQWGQGFNVGPEFTLARATTGHRVHVVVQKIACTKCHTQPTKTSPGPVKPENCASCHEKEGKLEHASDEAEKRFGAGAKADCTTCHAFKFEGKDRSEAEKRADALRTPVDGGTGPTGVHGIETFGPGDCKRCHETKQGDTPAVVSHLTEVCLNCHKPHDEQTPTSAPCSNCHKDVHTTHASKGKSEVETCGACHQDQHAPASAALSTCIECHSKEKPVIPATALFAGGHAECTGCHKPHDFDSAKAAPCSSCHTQVHVLGGGKIAAHNGCTNCHSPHNVRGTPSGACANCHKNVHPTHPAQGGPGGCVGCHDPHPTVTAGAGGVHAVSGANDCTSCHKMADSEHAFHRGVACENCHKPHDFKVALGNLTLCGACHANRVTQVGANAGHKACTQCHQGLPHKPEAQEVGCATCHAKEHAKVNKGHQACNGCHEPHSGSQAAACSSCHKEEHRTAPKGHQACTNCHEPHGGAPQKACASCHSGEAKSPHGLVSSGCQTCHSPHGPSGSNGPAGADAVPACTSCHKPAALPGLHAEVKHQTCTTCHGGHADLPGTLRTTCLNCHKDRADHFPNADRCANCHLFTKTR